MLCSLTTAHTDGAANKVGVPAIVRETDNPTIDLTSLEIAAMGTVGYLLVWFVLLMIVVTWDSCCGSKRKSYQPP